MKSSSLEGLEPIVLLVASLGLGGLDRGDGTTLPTVLLAGLAWLDWDAWLEWLEWVEWLVLGLVGFFGGLGLLALGVLAFLVAEGLVLVSLLLGAWPGRRTEYGPAVAGLATSSAFGAGRNLVGLIGATERPP